MFFGTNLTSEINDGRYINHQIENMCSDKGMSQNLLKINILSTAICQSTYFHTREPCHSSNNIIYFLFYCLTFFPIYLYIRRYTFYTLLNTLGLFYFHSKIGLIWAITYDTIFCCIYDAHILCHYIIISNSDAIEYNWMNGCFIQHSLREDSVKIGYILTACNIYRWTNRP